MTRKVPLTLDEHRLIAAILHTVYTEIVRIRVDLANLLGKSHQASVRAGRAAEKLSTARSALEEVLYRDYRSDFDTRVYYPGPLAERADLTDRLLDLRAVGHIQGQWYDAPIGMCKGLARSRIHSLRASPQGLFKQCASDASVRAGDQNCLVFDVHTLLLSIFDLLFAITHRSAGRIRSFNNKSCFYPDSASRSRISALTFLRYRFAQRHMPASGAMIVLPSSVNEYSTATAFDCVTCLAIKPADSRLRRVLVSIRCEMVPSWRRNCPCR